MTLFLLADMCCSDEPTALQQSIMAAVRNDYDNKWYGNAVANEIAASGTFWERFILIFFDKQEVTSTVADLMVDRYAKLSLT